MANTNNPTPPLTGASLREQLLADIAREEATIKRHNDIIRVLTPHNDKTITRRLNKVLEPIGGRIAYRFGMIYVEFPGVGENGYVSHLLAYDSVPVVDMKKFHEHYDMCSGSAAEERNVERHASAATPRCNNAVADLNVFLAEMNIFAAAIKDMGALAREINDAAKKAAYEKLGWYTR